MREGAVCVCLCLTGPLAKMAGSPTNSSLFQSILGLLLLSTTAERPDIEEAAQRGLPPYFLQPTSPRTSWGSRQPCITQQVPFQCSWLAVSAETHRADVTTTEQLFVWAAQIPSPKSCFPFLFDICANAFSCPAGNSCMFVTTMCIKQHLLLFLPQNSPLCHCVKISLFL